MPDFGQPYTEHVCIHAGRNKTCIMCSVVGNKTKISREVRKSYYKCAICDVFLCKGASNCFSNYHELMKDVDLKCINDRRTIKQVLSTNYHSWFQNQNMLS
jgi:hypothetical protein